MQKATALLKHKRHLLFSVDVTGDEEPFNAVFNMIALKLNNILSEGYSGPSIEDLIDEDQKKNTAPPPNPSRYYVHHNKTQMDTVRAHFGYYGRKEFQIDRTSSVPGWKRGNVIAQRVAGTDGYVVFAGQAYSNSTTRTHGIFRIDRKVKARGGGVLYEYNIKAYTVNATLNMPGGGYRQKSFVFDGKKIPPQHMNIRVTIPGENGNSAKAMSFQWDLAIDAEEARMGTIFDLYDTANVLCRRVRQIVYASTTVGRTCQAAMMEVSNSPLRVRV